MIDRDPFNLQRFLREQEIDYAVALEELRRGQKESHWIWYIFPQVSGLGLSSMSQKFAIHSRDEATAYLNHPILGSRLRECCDALLAHKGQDIEVIMGYPDDLKLRSSMTLFAAVSKKRSVFHELLATFYEGEEDQRMLDFLNGQS
ncbi:MAG: DUF1810 domain-containing protein [Thiolinea sp.]